MIFISTNKVIISCIDKYSPQCNNIEVVKYALLVSIQIIIKQFIAYIIHKKAVIF